MIRIGITGGLGSGKSHICGIFLRLKIPVYTADIESKKLTDTDPEIRHEITSAFGSELYTNNGVNRIRLAEIIFTDPSKLKKINAIIHPRVASHFKLWCMQHHNAPYVLHESAIILESGVFRNFEKVITVYSPDEMRLHRVLQRPNMTREKALAIMKNQLPDSEKIKQSDFIIYNDESRLVTPQVLAIHKKLLDIC